MIGNLVSHIAYLINDVFISFRMLCVTYFAQKKKRCLSQQFSMNHRLSEEK